MKQNTVNPEKINCKQPGKRQGQTPEQCKEQTNKILDAVLIGLEEMQKRDTAIITGLADIKIDLAEIRAELAKMRADSVAFRAGLTEIQTTIRAHNNRNFPHLQESAVNQ